MPQAITEGVPEEIEILEGRGRPGVTDGKIRGRR
jgi:hypothetical protein